MSDSDRTHYRDNMQDYFSVSDRDSELEPSEASEFIASPRRRADASQEEILGGSGPENLFLENARRRLEIPDKCALDEAFMAENNKGAVGGTPGDILGLPVEAEESRV